MGRTHQLRIVQVASPTSAGGLERVLESLAIGHHERGHHVVVAAPLLESEIANPVLDTLRTAGVPVAEIRVARARSYLSERRGLREVLRGSSPNVVHTHGYRRDLLHRWVAARLGLPTVTTVHGPSKTGGIKGAFFEWLQRRNYRRFDAVVAVSESLRQQTVADGVSPKRVHLIPNAWSGREKLLSREAARQALELNPARTVVGWVGRMIAVKGADVFLEALSLLPEPRPTAVIIGYGPEEAELRASAERLGIASSVKFYTEIRDAGRYFRAFDTYVLSSRSEGLPIVVLEAIAATTPIVATRVGGVPEVLDVDTALLVRSEDSSSLADAIALSLHDRDSALRRARRAAMELDGRHAIGPFLDRYERVYRSVIRKVESPFGPRPSPRAS